MNENILNSNKSFCTSFFLTCNMTHLVLIFLTLKLLSPPVTVLYVWVVMPSLLLIQHKQTQHHVSFN